MKSKQLGNMGENIAKDYLQNRGFKIIDSNVLTRFGEIDIVAYKDRCYHFIEVKARTNNEYGSAIEGISTAKYKHILKSIDIYLTKNRLHNAFVSVDVIAIDFKGGNDNYEVDWVQNITI